MHQSVDDEEVTVGEYLHDAVQRGSDVPWLLVLLISVIGFALGWFAAGNGG